jgi:TetR/AcrR family transcriptional regulator, lmrAB and yxaGH operons repressor
MPRPDHSRAALVSAAGRLLRRQGYAATGLAQIVAESGASVGSLYHHFPDGKEGLAVAAIDEQGAVIAALLARLLDRDGDVAALVVRWLDAMGGMLAADVYDGCPIAPSAVESIAASPRLRAAAGRAFGRWQELLAARLEREGWTAADASADASAVLALLEGALMLARTLGDAAPLRAAGHAARRLLAAPAPGEPAR